jgi:hypothetical protein
MKFKIRELGYISEYSVDSEGRLLYRLILKEDYCIGTLREGSDITCKVSA